MRRLLLSRRTRAAYPFVYQGSGHGLALFAAACHAGDFTAPRLFVERGAERIGAAIPHHLGDLEVFVGAAGNLGPVGDEDHLTHGGQIFKSVRKAVQGQAAHAGVDFIEDEGGILGGGHNAGESQQETGELAARSDAVQGLRRLTGVGSPENADLFVHYAWPELGADIFGNDPHAFGKAEASKLIFQFSGKGFTGCAAFGSEFFGYGFKFRGEGIDIMVYLFDIERARVEKVNLLLDFRPEGQDLGMGAVHPALQLGELEEPLFHGVEVCRHVVRNRGMPERSRKVVQFLDEAVHGFRAWSEGRVAFRHAFEQAVKAGRHVQEARRITIAIEHVQGRLVVLACLFGAAGAGAPAGMAAVFVLVWFLSGRMIRPIAESYRKQRRFITDAGHEIKTPITIIDADLEILRMETGDNEWVQDIRTQTARLAALTNDLICLSKMEEEEVQAKRIEFPLSDAVRETAESFQTLAKTRGRTLLIHVEPMLSYVGDEKALCQLVEILIDNALKYSREGDTVHLTLERQGRFIRMAVENGVENMDKDVVDNMFDRFYRADRARASDGGGHGIGLSIAQAVVSAHRGKISAAVNAGRLTMTVLFPAD